MSALCSASPTPRPPLTPSSTGPAATATATATAAAALSVSPVPLKRALPSTASLVSLCHSVCPGECPPHRWLASARPSAASEWLSPLSPPSVSVRSLDSLSPFTAGCSSSSSPASSVAHTGELDGSSDELSEYSNSHCGRSVRTSEPNSPAAPHSTRSLRQLHAVMARHNATFDYGVEGGDSHQPPLHSQQLHQHLHYVPPSLPYQPQPHTVSSMSLLHSAALASPSSSALPSASSLFSPSLDTLYGGSGSNCAHPYSSMFGSLQSPSPSSSFAAPYGLYSSGGSASSGLSDASAGAAVPVQSILPPSAFRRPSDVLQESPATSSSVRTSVHSTAIYPPPAHVAPQAVGTATGRSPPQSPSVLAASSSRFFSSQFGYSSFPSPPIAGPSHFSSQAPFGSLDGALPSPGLSQMASNPFVLPVQQYTAASSSSQAYMASHTAANGGFYSATPSAFTGDLHVRRPSTESAESQSPLHLPLAPLLLPSPSQPQPHPNPFAMPCLPPVDHTAGEHRAHSDGDGSQPSTALLGRVKTEPVDMRLYLTGEAAPTVLHSAAWSHAEVAASTLYAPPAATHFEPTSSRPGGAMGSIRPCGLCGVSLQHDFDEVQHALYVHSRHLCTLCRHQSESFPAHSAHLCSHNPQRLPFSCSLCGKGFSKKFNMSTHFASHSALKRHECPICHQLYSQKSYLRLHMRTHSGVKPYKCDWPGCGKAFGMRSDVKKHRRVHSGEKPYTCRQCGRSFNHSSNYNRHRRKRTQHCSPDSAPTPASNRASNARTEAAPVITQRAAHVGNSEDSQSQPLPEARQKHRTQSQHNSGGSGPAASGGHTSTPSRVTGKRSTAAPLDVSSSSATPFNGKRRRASVNGSLARPSSESDSSGSLNGDNEDDDSQSADSDEWKDSESSAERQSERLTRRRYRRH